MTLRVLFVAAVCLQLAAAFPTSGYHFGGNPCGCGCAPQPIIQVVEKPYPVIEQVNVPVPAPVPVPVVAPTITETVTRLAGTTSGNAAEQKVTTTSAPPPPVTLPLPNPCPSPCAPTAGAELIFDANAPALALGAAPLALNGAPYTLNEIVLPAGVNLNNLAALNGVPIANFGNGALGLSLGGTEFILPGSVPHSSLPVANTVSVPNSIALPPGLNLPSGITLPSGYSVPLGLPFAGQPVSLSI